MVLHRTGIFYTESASYNLHAKQPNKAINKTCYIILLIPKTKPSQQNPLFLLPLPLLGKKKQVDLKGTESLMSGTVQMNLTVKAVAGIFAASVSDRVGRKPVLLCGASVSGQAWSFSFFKCADS